MGQVTGSIMSYLLPLTSFIPSITFVRRSESPESGFFETATVSIKTSSDLIDNVSNCTPPEPIVSPTSLTRKQSWLRNPPRIERRQSCRRMSSRLSRDWSVELEESEYFLPFPLHWEERERGRMKCIHEDLTRLDTVHGTLG